MVSTRTNCQRMLIGLVLMLIAFSALWMRIHQHNNDLLRECESLDRKIVHRAAEAKRSANRSASSPTARQAPADPVDALAGDVLRLDSTVDASVLIPLREEISRHSKDDLLARLGALQATGLSDRNRSFLEAELLGALARVNIDEALEYSLSRIDHMDEAAAVQFAGLFSTLIRKDPTAAALWLDQQIAAGAFDTANLAGKNLPFIHCEAELARYFCATNKVAELRERLLKTAMDQRIRILEIANREPADPYLETYAAVLRETLTKSGATDALSSLIAGRALRTRNYDKTTALMKRLAVSEDEIRPIVSSASMTIARAIAGTRPLSMADLENLRRFVSRHDPEKLNDRIAGALGLAAELPRNNRFEPTTGLLLDYHRKYQEDKVIERFIEVLRSRDARQKALALIPEISDPGMREQLTERYGAQ